MKYKLNDWAGKAHTVKIPDGTTEVAGVADLILLEARGNYGALCIEMKTPRKSSRQNPNQKLWQAATEKAGNAYVVVRTFEAFQDIIRDYLSLKPLNSLF